MVVLRQMPLALQPFTEQETVVNNQPTNSSAIAITIDTTSRIIAAKQADQQQQNELTAVDTGDGDDIPAASWESKNQPDSTLPPTASVFPQFLQDYIKFHNQNRGHPAAKYLIWRCPPNAGGGDVSQFLQPHTIDWTIPNSIKAYMQTLVKYSAVDSYSHPFFQQLQIPARLADIPMIDMRSNLWSEHVNAVVLVNDTKCVQKQLWTKEPVPNPFAPQQKVLFRMGFWALFTFADQVHERKLNMQMRTGLLLEQQLKRQEREEAMQQQPTRRRLQQDPLQLKINQAVRTHYAKETARKQKAMIQHQLAEQEKRKSQLQRLQKETAMAGKTTLQPYIAVHIRTGNGGNSWNDPARHNTGQDFEQFYHCAKRLQDGIYQRQRQQCLDNNNNNDKNTSGNTTTTYDYDYQRPLPPLPIYVAADNVIAKQALVALDQQQSSQTIRVLEQMPIYHIDRSRKGGHGDENTVWGEFNVLLESTCLVESRSGFSDLAAWLQPAHGKRCAILYSKCNDPVKVAEALDALEFKC
ncbi:expressed unknown protein [Seminavis robusta]|uniref:Uncharacterized protein n=1 Tax=Seminavis robusta TaxID=568900 RepID=A0A9N8EMZ2_9STRA|nr:expressed unknown protein [Seminavis robusta]|eukprot:Sro1492_g277210.1 n/a (524) ;mRNA; f:11993-13816